ncbi:MAG TPA: glycosyltransferase family 2 protein [Anaerolineae bacterium]
MNRSAVSLPLLSVVVPTRNEATNVEPLLRRLSQAVGHLALEVIFVDDSSDETANTIRRIAASFPFAVRLLARLPADRNGLSGAVVDGLRAARGEWVAIMDADLQHPPEVVPRMLTHAQATGADMVVGSRTADLTGPRGLGFWRALTSQALTIMARTVFPRLLKNASDPLTGLFLIRRQAVDADLLRPDGFKILLEILVRCPHLHVSEVFFDFAPRHHGASKADLHEGFRFFRHLLRLRLTAYPEFTRFLTVGTLGLVGNNLILLLLVERFGLHYLLSVVLAAELFTLLNFYLTETWVFSGRRQGHLSRRFLSFWLMNHLFLFALRLPIIFYLVSSSLAHYVVANLLSILAVSLLRYVLSEQWIWTSRLLSRQRQPFRYDLHGIVGIESHVPLPELAYFRTLEPLAFTHIRLLLDRHGTPTCVPGAICYDEKLGRFGFGLAIMPGDCTEVIVSPALEKSPYVLYKSILEPLLRWTFVRKGYALVYGACAAGNGRAVLITPQTDTGKTPTVLRAIAGQSYAFLSDDMVILGRDGEVKSYPKPITVSQRTLRAVDNSHTLSRRERLALYLQGLLYFRSGRRAGLWLSQRRLPLATLNIVVQRLIPPPKYMVDRLVPNVAYTDTATLTDVMIIEKGRNFEEALAIRQAVQIVSRKNREVGGFPPYAFLMEQMGRHDGLDLYSAEAEIVDRALQRCSARRVGSYHGNWWQHLPAAIPARPSPVKQEIGLSKS